MKKTFTILFASTALAVGAGIPAWSAMHDAARPHASRETVEDASDEGANLLFASDDGRLDRDHGPRLGRGDDDDGHHEGDDDDDSDDDDDGYRGGAAVGPARAGTVAPPNNGLFGSGAAPKVKVN
ncbi:hypothetical protein N7E70_000715 [Aminobacter sp. NyZ550]|uniref:hypothetical protein n=1 Tax=Aminobacter sp. NyZ550 TaxID=2979870 RepID=UPI0021D5862A|nr:hypothetical protein [Aminobacter sp. NyZ550]WAX95440.1 hypothetical protein N7E70_000715 [Aminobacter sp. NyZ550]